MGRHLAEKLRRLAPLAIPGFAVAMVTAAILDVQGIYEPRWLRLALNTIFLFVPGGMIAYVSIRGYLASGSLALLLFGGGAMAYGTGSWVAGWMISLFGAIDAGTLVHHTMAGLGAVLVAASGFLVPRPPRAISDHLGRQAILLYAGLGIALVGLTTASLHGLTPTFVLAGGNFTPPRDATLALAAAGFSASALLLVKRYIERRSDFDYWAATGLALLSVGLFGLFLQSAVGGLVGWFSRAAQYVGSIYLLVAVVQGIRDIRSGSVPVSLAIAELFREAEENLRVVVETATDAIIAVDQDGRVLLWNGAAEQLFGYRAGEAMGAFLGDVTGLHSQVKAWNQAQDTQGSPAGVIHFGSDLEAEVRRKSGEAFAAEYSVSTRRTATGWIGTIILRDVSERKRTEEALRKSEERYRSLFENMLNGFAYCRMVFDQERPHDFIYLAVNRAFETLTGLKNVVGKRVSEVIPGLRETDPELFEIYGRVARTGVPERFETYVEALGMWFAVAVYSPSNEHFVAVFDVITDRKRLEQERIRLEAQLRQQQKIEAIGTLASGVAHEINNPINGILNYAQLILDAAAPETQVAEYAGEILQETERVATTVRNLLQFARQEQQAHSTARLVDIIEQTLSLFRAVLRRDQIAITVDVPEDLPPIECRSQQLQQVFMNLLTNARDALNAKYPGYHEAKTLVVRVVPFDQGGRPWLRLTVADQGTGIPPEIQARIFDPFFTTKSRDKSSGLGLFISHGIVKDHHGRLYFETEMGIGTQFHLDLPVEEK